MARAPRIFISHASADKLKLKPLVELLLESGFDIFVDNPAAMGFSRAESARIRERLRVGSPWPDQLVDQIKEADCLLLCWSAAAAKSRDVTGEYYVALAERNLAICALEFDARAVLPASLQAMQTPLVFASNGALARDPALALVDDLRLLVEGRRRRRHTATMVPVGQARRTNSSTSRDLDKLPMFAGRSIQDSKLAEALKTAQASRGVCPVIVAGPNNELPSKYVERFADCGGVPIEELRSGKSANERGSLFLLWVTWTEGNADQFIADYEQQLCNKLKCDRNSLGASLKRKNRPIVILSEMQATAWSAGEIERLLAWTRFWADIATAFPDSKAMPVFCLVFPDSPPGWIGMPPPGLAGYFQRRANKRIWEAVDALRESCEARSDTGRLLTLNLLPPIQQAEGSEWLKHFTPRLQRAGEPFVANAEDEVDKLFRSEEARRSGVNHQLFKDRLSSALRS